MLLGNCNDELLDFEDNTFDSCVTDPPYGLSFMAKKWDHDVPSAETWRSVLRVLKPGAFLLAFFGTRTYHRGVCAIEDAGFEIRDQVQWVYGSGFPKSHDVSKAIDKKLGLERKIIAQGNPVKRMIPGADQDKTGSWVKDNGREYVPTQTVAASPEAAKWEGWGTALKPAHEPIVLARKPIKGSVSDNILTYAVGGLDIDGSRVGTEQEGALGRWPANLIHDGSDEVLAEFPDARGQMGAVRGTEPSRTGGPATNTYGEYGARPPSPVRIELEKTAARFFYCAKASKSDRDHGLRALTESPSAASQFRPNHAEKAEQGENGNPYGRWTPVKNHHPTVKPTELMRYLVTMVTPEGGTVLDPFAGSGSTGRGAVYANREFVGIEMEEGYLAIANARIAAAKDAHTITVLEDLL